MCFVLFVVKIPFLTRAPLLISRPTISRPSRVPVSVPLIVSQFPSRLERVKAVTHALLTGYSCRMTEKPPSDPSDHAHEFARTWADELEEHCTIRMQELGIPDNMNGQPDYDGNGQWRAFNPDGRQGRENTTGVVLTPAS